MSQYPQTPQPVPPPGYPQGVAPPPPTLGYAAPPEAGRRDLRAIAMRQKGVIFCILGYLVLFALQFALPRELRIVVSLAAAAVSVTAAVFVFMLAVAVYNTGLGIVLGILTLIPILGLFVLLIVNSRATNILRQRGIRVGLLGADARQIPSPGLGTLP